MLVEIAKGYGIEVKPSQSLVITANNILAQMERKLRAAAPAAKETGK